MQQFSLSGHLYDAPSKVGTGAQIRMATEWKRIFRRENPGVPTVDYTDDGTPIDLFSAWLSEHMTDYEVILAMLRVICKKTPGCPDVADAFETCEPEELEAVQAFFIGTAPASESTSATPEPSPETSATTRAKRARK